MRAAWPIVGWILAGALAAAAGSGIFLYRANADRRALTDVVRQAEERVTAAETAQRATANDADAKVRQASEELARAQALLQALQKEQQALAHAEQLSPSRTAARWPQTVSIPVKVSFRVPPTETAFIPVSSNAPVVAVSSAKAQGTGTNLPWLLIRQYDADLESKERTSLQNPDEETYVVDGHVLIGFQGTSLTTGHPHHVWRVQLAASSTHLITADIDTTAHASMLEDILSTFSFAP